MLQKCRGIDISTEVEDDNGGLPKTVSVENSFKRGSVRTQERVCQSMEVLYTRLPRLLHERAGWSTASAEITHASAVSCSKRPLPSARDYPTTIRLTARIVVKKSAVQASPAGGRLRRRPFVTQSKQVAFDGQAFMLETSQAAAFLRRCVNPLLRDLVFKSTDIDVTRLSIAVTNFRSSTSLVLKRSKTSSPPKAGMPPLDMPPAAPVVASQSSIFEKNAKRQRIDQYFEVKTSK